MKTCTKCKIEKETIQFDKKKLGLNGLNAQCKNCVSEYNKKYREQNKEKIKKHYQLNKESYKEYKKNWCKENKDKLKEYKNKYRSKESARNKEKETRKIYEKNNKEKIAEYRNYYNKIYYQNNKEKIAEKTKEYEKNNKEKINKRTNEYQKKRKKVDSLYKLRICIRDSVVKSFKRGSNQFKKNARTESILGCTIEEFIKHIQSQFTKGMTIENHGKWHLDHIIPIATAKTEEDVIKLCHYTNYQPLWAKENISKGAKIIEKQLVLL